MEIAKIEAFKPEQHTLEECLLELEKYGAPNVTKSSMTTNPYWWATIDVFVIGKGVSFEVKYSHAKNPREAVNKVYERLMKALQKIRETE